MYRVLGLIAICFIGLSSISAQSGRRVTPSPTPETKVRNAENPSEYSESKPRTSRISVQTDRFPGVSIATEKKAAQAPAPSPAIVPTAATDDTETLRVETNLVTIPVSVFDRNGLYIPGLRQNDFKIFEDGVEQQIAYFGTTDKPITVALVIDVSPSTAYRIEEIQQAAIAFVNLLEPQDTVIVIEFDHGINVLAQATKDREKIFKAIRKADFGDGTSLYNAVDEALRKQLSKIEGRKAVVLFTDGVDTTSRKNSYDSTLNYAEEADSLVFPIYYNTYLDNRRRTNSPFPPIFGGGNVIYGGTSAEEYAVGRRYLEEIAEVTGGRVFRPEATPGGLTRAFEGIAEELRRQYNIGFVPEDEGRPGQRKNIKIRVNRPNLIIRARDSYIVGNAAGAPTITSTKK